MTRRIICLRPSRSACSFRAGFFAVAALLIASTALPAAATAATQLASGNRHSCELLAGGTVKCWGSNAYGQLGDGTTSDHTLPAPVSGITAASQISVGSDFSCAALSGGTVQCWGYNGSGQLGNGTVSGSLVPVTVKSSSTATLTGLSQVAAGGNHACALITSTGGVRCWGNNGYVQLGDGTTIDRTYASAAVKTSTGPVTGLTQIVTGQAHACGLYSTGSIRCWGNNDSGQLGNNSTTNTKTAVAVSGITTATQITAGGSFTCALLADATVKCWGYNGSGQLGDGTNAGRQVPVSVSGLSGVTRITAGPTSVCAATSDGLLYCWGDNSSGQIGDGTLQDQVSPTRVQSLRSVSAGSPSGSNGCALLTDGSIKCWGSIGSGLGFAYGSRSTPLAASSTSGFAFASIATGGAASCGVVTDGTVRCWGDPTGTFNSTWSTLLLGNANQSLHSAVTVSGIQNATQIALSDWHACVAITGGAVKCWGYDTWSQLGDSTAASQPVTAKTVTLASPDKARQVAVGYGHSCAIVAGGAIKCWGLNDRGQLGNSRAANSSAPINVKTSAGSNLTGATQIAAGDYSTCAVLTDGTVRCWGDDSYGQLGRDSSNTSDNVTPVTVSGLVNVTQITMGGNHACALVSDGTARCWGRGSYGEVGDGIGQESNSVVQVAGLKDVKQIEAGDQHTCATTNSRAVWCWGRNDNGQLGDGTTLSRSIPTRIRRLSATEVSAGTGHTCSIASDGAASCWGDDSYGQLGSGLQPAPIFTGLDFTSPPVALSNSTTASVSFTSDLPATIECSLDLAEWASCSNPLALTSLTEGDHVIGIRQGSADGVAFGALYSAWTIDVTAPAAPSIGNQPSAASKSTSISLRLSGESDGRFVCSLDGATPVSCNSPFEATGLTESTHFFSVRQTDAAGNTGDGTTVRWTVDLTAPKAPVITGTPSTATSQTSQSLAFSGEDGATIECALDSTTAYSACKTPISFSSLRNGSHTLRVRQMDAAGNVSPIGSATWTVDTVAPAAPTVTGIPIKPTNQTTQAASITGEAGASFRCALDSGDWAICSASPSFSSLREGTHVLSVQQADLAGNVSTTATVRWTVDLTPPVSPTITGTPSSLSNSTSQSFNLSGEDGATFQCALDTAIFTSCTATLSFTPLKDGSHTLSVKQTDVAGNQGTAASTTWVVDSTPPSAPGITGAPAKPTTQTSQSLTLSGENGASFQCALDSTTLSVCSSVQNFSSLRDGTHTFYSKQIDLAGNSGLVASVTWVVDTTAPAKPAVSGAPSNPTKSTTQSFSIFGEAGASFQCSLDAGEFTGCSSAPSFSSLQDGDHTLTVKQSDVAGNVGPAVSVSWTVDTTAPEAPVISGVPSRPTSSQAQSVTLSGESRATFTCSLDGGSFSVCSTSPSFNGLREGLHSLAVKQTDVAGNTGPAASVTWTVDITPPAAPAVIGAPVKPINSASQALSFIGEDGATFQCSIDSTTAYSSCSGSASFSGLAEGSHTFRVRQIDQAGNVGVAASVTWVVDLTAPVAPVVTDAPTNAVNTATQTLGFIGESGATFQCALDGSDYAACDPSISFSNLPEGQHALLVRQVDVAGNTGPARMLSWTIDRTALPPTLGGLPSKPTRQLTAAPAFLGEVGATFQCSLNEADWQACTSPRLLSGLAERQQTFRVRQTDVAGNTSDPASAVWVIDLTAPPAPTIGGAPVKPTNQTTQPFTLSGEDLATFQCSLDGGVATGCSSSPSFGSLKLGSHTLIVTQTDQAGNTGQPSQVTWTIDLTPPDSPGVTGAPVGPTNANTQSFTFTGETGATFQCSLDSAAFSSCLNPTAFSDLGDGQHALSVKQVDVAGNVGNATNVSWTVDRTALPPTVATVPSLYTALRNAKPTFTGESGATFQCSLDNAAWQSCTSPRSLSALSEAQHTFRVRQTDLAGNFSDPATATWTVDVTAPAAPVINGTSTKPTNQTTQTFTISGEDTATFTCSIDGGDFASCQASLTLTSLKAGVHKLAVKQTDAAGNIGPARTVSWTIDLMAPAAPALSGAPNGLVGTTGASVAFTGEAGAKVECRSDLGDWSVCASPLKLRSLPDGVHTFEVRQTDVAGNVGPVARAAWTVIAALPDATTQVSAGQAHSCAIVGTTGTAGCWGSSELGRTTLPAGKYLAISAGGMHTCAITLAGALSCFGSNAQGQTSGPTGVFGQVSAGLSHTCAIRTDGTLVCWGANDKGQVAAPQGTYTKVSAGSEHTCAITVAEELACWGNSDSNRLISPQGRFVDVSSGSDSSCAISDTGTLSCWGSDASGKSSPPEGTFHQVSVGRAHVCAVRKDGQILCWGSGSTGQTSVPGGAYTWVSSGSSHSCAMRDSGRVQCWGDDSSRQSTVPDIYPPAAPVITSAPAARTSVKNASVAFTTVKGTIVQCSFDDAAWAACASPRVLSALADGRHELRIRQLSGTGNASIPTVAVWEVDTIGPAAPTVVSAPPAVSASSSVSVGFEAIEGPARVQCRLDGKAWVNCSPPSFTTDPLTDGVHKLEMRQTDDVGNVGAIRTVSWTIDTVPPKAPTLGGVPPARTRASGAQISVTGEAGGTYECSIDLGDWSACRSPLALASLSEGSHSVSVRQTDAASNIGAPATAAWIIDTIPPTIDSLRVTRSGRNSIVDFSSRSQTDPATHLEWSNSPTVPKSTATPVAAQVMKGTTSVTIPNQATINWVRFADSAGNWTNWSQTR